MQHPSPTRRHGTALAVGLLATATVAAAALPSAAHQPAVAPAQLAASAPRRPRSPTSTTSTGSRCTVTPPAQSRHTTYRLGGSPPIGVLWTYAEDRDGDGDYTHVGGGTYDPDDRHLGPGRLQRRRRQPRRRRLPAALARHRLDRPAGDAAYEMLRGLTYLQTASGQNAGNVVLWMQPDGTLNPSAEPDGAARPVRQRRVLLAGPHDLGARRGLRGLPGRATRRSPRFLRNRLELAVDAVDRQVLDRYGDHLDIDGQPAPAWLIADGADASAEAVLGLSAYVAAGGSAAARTALSRLSEGIAELRGGDARHWPMGADPALGAVPLGLARLGRHDAGRPGPRLARARRPRPPPRRPSATRSPSTPGCSRRADPTTAACPPAATPPRSPTAPTRGSSRWSPPPRSPAGTRLEASPGSSAAWFFGANPAGEAMYDPATGRTFDGISGSTVRSTATRAPSPRSTGCCRCSRSTSTPRSRGSRAPPTSNAGGAR